MRTTPVYHNLTTNRSHQVLDRLAKKRTEIEQKLDRIEGGVEQEFDRLLDEIDDELVVEEKEGAWECQWERRERLAKIAAEEDEIKRDEIARRFDRLFDELDELDDEIIYFEFKGEELAFDRQALKLWLRDNRKPLLWVLTNFIDEWV